jgi:hypothetical protein
VFIIMYLHLVCFIILLHCFSISFLALCWVVIDYCELVSGMGFFTFGSYSTIV